MHRERILELADVFAEALLLVDGDGVVLMANAAAERALGVPAGWLAGQSLVELAVDPPEKIADYLRMVARTRQMLPGRLTLRHGDAPVPHHVRGARLSSADDDGIALVLRFEPVASISSRFVLLNEKIDALTREVVRRVAAEAERDRVGREREHLLAQEQAARLAAEQARAEAEAANRTKDEFLSTLSHELRTPLTAILGWSNILRTRTSSPAITERALASIERNARAQARLIEDILDVSHIITGKLQIEVAAIDLQEIARASLEVVRPSAEAKGVTLEAALDPAVTAAHGDADRLRQILWNLLSNAIKFTRAGGRVVLALTREQSRIVLRVTDTGQGIPRDFLPHVFERFRQEDSSSTRAYAGLGLGLAIAKHLTELHGGTIAAASEGPGHGATFTVSLPIPAVAARPRDPTSAKKEPPIAGDARLDGARVLVVDDEPDARELVAAALLEFGAEVVSAGSTAEALAQLEETEADALVSDIAIAGEDGHTLLYKARLLLAERERYLPALALTAYAGAEHAKEAYRAGFEAYLAKPVEPAALARAVHRLLRRG